MAAQALIDTGVQHIGECVNVIYAHWHTFEENFGVSGTLFYFFGRLLHMRHQASYVRYAMRAYTLKSSLMKSLTDFSFLPGVISESQMPLW